MPIRPLAEMTWEEVRAVHAKPWIVLLPIGAVEAHGPHLPLRTDGIIAEAWAHEAAHRLEGRGLESLIFPTIDYTPAPFAEAFPGTVSVRAETVTRLVLRYRAQCRGAGSPGLGVVQRTLGSGPPRRPRGGNKAGARQAPNHSLPQSYSPRLGCPPNPRIPVRSLSCRSVRNVDRHGGSSGVGARGSAGGARAEPRLSVRCYQRRSFDFW